MDSIKKKKLLSPLYKIKYRVRVKGWITIGRGCKLKNKKNIKFSNANQIASFCLICPHGNSKISFGTGVEIGMFSRIACINEVRIGNNVITGHNIFISDYNHYYQDVTKPISQQGNTPATAKVIIDDDCWIGTNVVIAGNVRIGKHCVIGANSLVNKDIPDFSVAVGNPAKVIKKYNFETQQWERVD